MDAKKILAMLDRRGIKRDPKDANNMLLLDLTAIVFKDGYNVEKLQMHLRSKGIRIKNDDPIFTVLAAADYIAEERSIMHHVRNVVAGSTVTVAVKFLIPVYMFCIVQMLIYSPIWKGIGLSITALASGAALGMFFTAYFNQAKKQKSASADKPIKYNVPDWEKSSIELRERINRELNKRHE